MDLQDRPHPRVEALESLRERLLNNMEVMPSGPQEGLRYVTENSITEAFEAPLPPLREFTAEVRTNGTVYVTAMCPRCNEGAPIRLEVGTVLSQDDDGVTLKLRGRSKAVTHLCGQMFLSNRLTPEGDTAFTLADIVGAVERQVDDDDDEEQKEAGDGKSD